MFRYLLLIPIVLLATPLSAKTPVTHMFLDNGMEIVVIEDNRQPVVTHMVWYRAGAADEPPGKSGIAHYLEHLMFKRTDELEPGDFSRIITENGGQDNAFTSYDYTGYYQRIASDRLDLVMSMEADRMVDLALTEEDVGPELAVVLEERSQRTDNNPGALFGEQRRAALYFNHPYAIPVIGWRHEIETLTRDDAMDWYNTHYAPNNAILVVAGDVTPEEVLRLAKVHYGPIPSRSLPQRVRPGEPPHLSARRMIFRDDRVRQPYALRTYLAPERDAGAQETAAALTILAEVLGGSGITSVLGESLQLDQKIAIATGAYYNGMSLDDTSFGVYVVPAPGVSLEDAEAAMDDVIATFLEEGPTQEHLDRIKAQVRAAEIYARDDQAGLAREYGTALTSGLTVADVEAWPDILAAVTADDIIAAGTAVFDERRSVTGWLMGEETSQ